MTATNRTVHAIRAGGTEIVRYEDPRYTDGKWFLESRHGVEQISLARAVDEAKMADHEKTGAVKLGESNGAVFDEMFIRIYRGGQVTG